MPSFRHSLAAGLLALGLAAAIPPAMAQQPATWSPWGGPDSPGGLLGGDPYDVVGRDANQPLRHDEVWGFLRQRFDQADANRDHVVTADELDLHHADPRRQAWFRAADTDRNNKLTPDEIEALSGIILRFHDANNDGLLQRHEVRRATPAAAPAAPATPAAPAPRAGMPAPPASPSR